jgi:phosphonate transport system substrate-binding protein
MTASYQMTVSPDFSPKRMPGWFIFNTWLQKAIGASVHLELYPDFASQRQAIAADRVDIIYANPFDAAMLVREKGFVPVCRAHGHADECCVVVPAGATAQTVEDLQPGSRLACTDDPDVRLIGMILLEPADLGAQNLEINSVGSYPLVAKALLDGRADVGFFLADAFDDLSRPVREQLRPLVRSEIDDIRHVLLAGPRLAALREPLGTALLGMADDPNGRRVLDELGFSAWESVSAEDTEFMIDLMDTLKA